MPHHGLNGLGMGTGRGQPSPTGVPQGMEVRPFTLMVELREEVALLATLVFLGIVLRRSQPLVASVSKVLPCHGEAGPPGDPPPGPTSFPQGDNHWLIRRI